MSDEGLINEALTAYLAEHFNQVKVKSAVVFDKDGRGLSFLIVADGAEYRVNLLDEVTEGLDRNALISLFKDNWVVSVMRDLSGFSVTLTNSGCIFGDV